MPRLSLALAGPGGHPDPLELAPEGGTAGAVGLVLRGEPRLLLLEPRGVVALPWDPRATIELENPTRDVVEEVSIVGHRDHRPGVLLQRTLEPRDRLGVEMVGRLVEEQQVGPREKQSAQGDPASLATGEDGHVGVARGESQRVHGDLEGPLEVPCPGCVDLRLEVRLLREERVDVGVRFAERGADLVEAVDQRLDLTDALGHVAGDVLGRVELRLLGEVPDGEPGGQAGLTGESVVLARHDAKQGGLAGSVGTDDTDLRPRVEGEVDPLEDFAVGRVEAPKVAHGEDELWRHGPSVAQPARPRFPAPPGRSETRTHDDRSVEAGTRHRPVIGRVAVAENGAFGVGHPVTSRCPSP